VNANEGRNIGSKQTPFCLTFRNEGNTTSDFPRILALALLWIKLYKNLQFIFVKKESVQALAIAAVATFFTVIFCFFIAYPLPWVVAAITALSNAGFAIRNELRLVEKNPPPSWEY